MTTAKALAHSRVSVVRARAFPYNVGATVTPSWEFDHVSGIMRIRPLGRCSCRRHISRQGGFLMPWAKLDDGYLTHPKAMRAGIEGRALHVAAILYSSRELTDGQIETGVLPGLGGLAGVKNAAKTAELLVILGLFERTATGYAVHDYLDYNPSRADVMADRESKREAGRKGAHSRWHGGSKTEPIAPPMAGAMAGAMAPPMANGWQNDAPVPHTPTSVSKETSVGAQKRPPRPAFSDEDRAALVTEFGPQMADVGERIDLALSHKNAAKYTNLRLYVRNWLKRDLDELRQKGIVPIGKNKPLDDPFASMVVRGYDS